MSSLIHSGPYQVIKKDPIDRLFRKLTEMVLTLNPNGSLDETTYKQLRPQHKQPPRIYGLPKIHKPNIPLRPTVSYVNTFAYNLSSYLSSILSPLAGRSIYTVQNSTKFVQQIKPITISDHKTIVSFDVESLFTNVPIKGAIEAALRRLQTDDKLSSRTTLSPSQIAQLLEFTLTSTYFM